MSAIENRLLILAGALTAAAAGLSAFLFYGPVPCQDDWILIPLVEKILQHTVSFSDFWAFHNEHRLLIPKWLLSYWAVWTRWDMSGIAWLDLALLVGATAALSGLAEANPSRPFWKRPSFWAACIVTLSFRATRVTLWPIMLSAYLCSAAVVVGFASVARKPESLRRWVFAAICCAVSTYSFAGGVLSWVAMLPLGWGTRRQNPRATAVALGWLLATAVALGLYFNDYRAAPGNPLFALVGQRPLAFLMFFLTYLGSLFDPLGAPFFGALGLGLAARIVRDAIRSGKPQDWGMVSILLFVVANGLLTSLGRLCFGLRVAVMDRYLPISCFFWAALSVYLAQPKPFSLFRADRRQAVFAFLITSLMVVTPRHAQITAWAKESHAWAEEVIRKKDPRPEELSVIYYDPEQMPGYIEILKKRKLSVFRDEP